ncbi:MAG: tRNA pseudouridine(38-40) synthase TruA [Mycoplasmoidaceae bacterium]
MRYLVNLEYDGSNYYGWSKQKNKASIQEHLEKALSKIFKEKILIHSSGRTDRGVHALNQYFHFDANLNIEPLILRRILNKRINNDLYIKKVILVKPDFHARYSAKDKTYLFKINNKQFNPFQQRYELYYEKEIDLEKLQSILNEFIGEHDFFSFSTTIVNYRIRKINFIEVSKRKGIISIKINGNGFLRHMVRMMIGYALLVLENKRDFNSIKELLDYPSKGKSGIKISPNGLYLYSVNY